MEGEKMSLKEKVTYAVNKIKFVFGKSRVVPSAGLIIGGLILDAIGFDKAVNKYTKATKEYKNSEILKPMLIGMLKGNPDYESIHEMDDDPEFYCSAFHMKRIPSEPTMRQRMDEIGNSMNETIENLNLELFKTYHIEPSALGNGYVPVDIDVSPFINEKCKKEGISKTYKRKDGYAPILAYIGTEGYLLATELREGKQHCQSGTPDFLMKVLKLAREITDKPLMFRLDSGNDAGDNIGLFMEECFKGDNICFVIKRNLRKESPSGWLNTLRGVCKNVKTPREGKQEFIGETFKEITYNKTIDNAPDNREQKHLTIRTIYDITERECDHDGQYYIVPKVECDMYFTSLNFADEDIIELYHNHGEMEQFHSEIKTDMDAELFASGKFATNELILVLLQLSYNIVRAIGQELVKIEEIPIKHPVKRRRLRTVINKIINAPGVVVKHARKVTLDLGSSNVWRQSLGIIYERFDLSKTR